MPTLSSPKLEYAVITVQFDPVTNTDYLLTRQEFPSGSLTEAKQIQTDLIPQLESNCRCYIQERLVHTYRYGKRATSLVERYEILSVKDIVEIKG